MVPQIQHRHNRKLVTEQEVTAKKPHFCRAFKGFTHNFYNGKMLVAGFNYHLPGDLIAQEPLAERAASRMLRLDRNSGRVEDRSFRDFPALLRPADLVVLNNTRVFPARLYGRRSGSKAQPLSAQNPASRDFLKGRVEALLTWQLSTDPNEWECLV